MKAILRVDFLSLIMNPPFTSGFFPFFFLNTAYGESLIPERQEFGDPHEGSRLIDQIEGVYKHRFKNLLVDGTSFESEDILEIVRVAKDAMYFKIHLEFYNAHFCDLYGIAKYIKDKSFLFTGNDAGDCILEIKPTTEGILLTDGAYGGAECRQFFCGMRGGFDKKLFKKDSKRPIRYMEILKNSTEYKESIKNMKSNEYLQN